MKKRDVIWWGDKDPHEKIVQLCQSIDGEHGTRRAMNVHHLRLYADRDLYGAGGASWNVASVMDRIMTMASTTNKPKLSINVIRNMINAATSMICRSRPRPFFLTTGGDWDLWKKAKKRTQFCEAIFHAEKTYQLGSQVVQHANILGTGAIKIVRDYESKRVRHEQVYIGEILVDDLESVYGTPRNYFQIRAMDKLVLREMYPDAPESAIERAKPARITTHRGTVTDQVIVVEAWHLPSSDPVDDEEDDEKGGKRKVKKTDGRYAVVTDGGTLHDAPYRWEHPPFAFFRWETDPLGFYGTGIASELTGIQYEINETIRNIQANWWSGGNLKVLVPRGSKIVKGQISNDLRGAMIEYTGQPPTWITTEAVAPGLMSYLQFLIEQAYNITGISQLGAQSQTPAASMSGRARLVHENSESLRFLPAQRRHEQFYVDIARRSMEAAADIYEECGEDYEVIFAGKQHLDPIKYSDIASSEDDRDVYEVQCEPTSILPSTAAGKLEFVEALEARGYIDQTQAKRMLDYPDIKRELDFDTAPVDLIDERLTNILMGKEYIAPTPEMPLDLCLKRSLQAIMLAEQRNVPQETIELLRKWRDEVQAHMPPPAPPAPPPGPPGLPPTGPGLPAPAFPEQVPMPPQDAVMAPPSMPAPQAA